MSFDLAETKIDQVDPEESPPVTGTPIFDVLAWEYQTHTGAFSPQDPLDTTVPIASDPVFGNAEPS